MNFEPVQYSVEYPHETIRRKRITEDQIIGWTINHEFAILKDTNRDRFHLAVRVVDLYRDVTRLKLFQETDKMHPSIITPRQMHQCVRKWADDSDVNAPLTLR